MILSILIGSQNFGHLNGNEKRTGTMSKHLIQSARGSPPMKAMSQGQKDALGGQAPSESHAYRCSIVAFSSFAKETHPLTVERRYAISST